MTNGKHRMESNDQSRFSLVLDRARRALDEPSSRRQARPARARLVGAVHPSTLALVDRIRAAGRELSRMDPLTLALRLRQRGDQLRAAMFHDQTKDRDDG